jgi:hypothetical protein
MAAVNKIYASFTAQNQVLEVICVDRDAVQPVRALTSLSTVDFCLLASRRKPPIQRHASVQPIPLQGQPDLCMSSGQGSAFLWFSSCDACSLCKRDYISILLRFVCTRPAVFACCAHWPAVIMLPGDRALWCRFDTSDVARKKGTIPSVHQQFICFITSCIVILGAVGCSIIYTELWTHWMLTVCCMTGVTCATIRKNVAMHISRCCWCLYPKVTAPGAIVYRALLQPQP